MKIFLDIDGVVGNWDGHYLKTFGIKESSEIKEVLKSGKKIDDLFDAEEVWENINKKGTKFWETIPLYPWSNKLIDRLKKHGELAFLSSPGNIFKHNIHAAQSSYGKTIWAKQFDIPLILCSEKYLLANKKTLLIDDTEKKIDKFVDYGGWGFLWPNSYHILDKDITFEEVMETLEEMISKINFLGKEK